MTRPNMLLLAIAVLPTLAACSPGRGNGVYKLTPQEAFGRLQEADLGAFDQARRCGTDLSFAIGAEPSRRLRWSILAHGREIAFFTVQLEARADGTLRTVIEATPDQGVGTGLRRPLRPAVEELVDSALTGRSFDPQQLGPAPDPDPCAPLGGKNLPVPGADAAEGGITAGHRVPVDSPAPSPPNGGPESPAAPFGAATSPQGSFGQPSAGTAGAFGQPAVSPNPGGGSSESEAGHAPALPPH